MNKFSLIYHTIRHLRFIQIRYQLWYRILRGARQVLGIRYPLKMKGKAHALTLERWIEKTTSLDESTNTYRFLNLSKQYTQEPKWDESGYGKLWAYNLNYMDYLLQQGLDEKTGTKLVQQFIKKLPANSTGLEPYPIALRGINWIKFFSLFTIENTSFSDSLYAQYHILANNLEYHLLGNHLLEDGFSLLYGAFYFKNKKWYNKAAEIIESELNQQILNDGAHFELSPMYHQIILDRLLDCINLVQNNNHYAEQDGLLTFMKTKAARMLSWLNQMTFSSGEIPLVNDSACGIAPSTLQLKQYAIRLNIDEGSSKLADSGYRRYDSENYECILDVGKIGPDYQPGHAHADTFNFILNIKHRPFIIDTGISTYETSETRLNERGTAAHNTVTIKNTNSSLIWSSFRVSSRAKVRILQDEKNHIEAQHDGYRRLKTIHQREWSFSKNQIVITDSLNGKIKEGKAHIWFSPETRPKQTEQTIEFEQALIRFEHAENIQLIPSQIPMGYNRFADTYKAEITFKDSLRTIIQIANNETSHEKVFLKQQVDYWRVPCGN